LARPRFRGQSRGHAQQRDLLRRIAILVSFAEEDPDGRMRLQAFRLRLHELGWTKSQNMKSQNIQTDYRFGAGDLDRTRLNVTEIVIKLIA
jgi:putative tryptophan/tyrosine transport system substrate-binding protein